MENKKILVSISTLALITVIALSLAPSASCYTYMYEDYPYCEFEVDNSNWHAICGASYDGNGVNGYSDGGVWADNGVYGETNSGSSGEAGVYGKSTDSACGVYGKSIEGLGVRGRGGSGSGDYGGYFTSNGYRGLYAKGYGSYYAAYFDGSIKVNGDIWKTGTCHFVMDHPTSQNEEIVYTCLEGGEVGLYTRGSAQLIKGEAIVQLPEDFSLVTSTEGLTVQVTATADCNGLYVVSKSPTEIVVKELSGINRNFGGSAATFDYLVNGIRKGYEDYQPIQDIKAEHRGPGPALALVDEEEKTLTPHVTGVTGNSSARTA